MGGKYYSVKKNKKLIIFFQNRILFGINEICKINFQKTNILGYSQKVYWEKTQKTYFTTSFKEYSFSRLTTDTIYIPRTNPSIRVLV